MCRCTDIMFFQNPPYRASRQLLIPRNAAVGTSLSPLPCQAWHGYGVNSAHSVEVEVGADGPASAPLSGAAAAAPPAGAAWMTIYHPKILQPGYFNVHLLRMRLVAIVHYLHISLLMNGDMSTARGDT
jgi:hypothetical protein